MDTLCGDPLRSPEGEGVTVSRRRHRGAAVVAFVLALTVGVTACQAGFDSQSYQIDPDNAETKVGDLLVRNLVMVKAEEGEMAGIAGTFVNTGSTADVLQSVQIEAAEGTAGGQAGAISLSPDLEVPAGSAVTVGSGDAPPLVVPDAKDLRVGTFVTMTLTFREAGAADLKVPLEDAYSYYASIAPTPTPDQTLTGPPLEPTPGATTPLEQPGSTVTPSPTATP
jgi:copper(I)-binding protein